MSNKIDGYGYSPLPSAVSTPASGRAGASAGAVPGVRAVQATDSVALTSDAHSLQRLEKAVAAAPDTDSARVDKIRAQLRDGTYTINPRSIAAALARTEWELEPVMALFVAAPETAEVQGKEEEVRCAKCT